MGLPWWRSGWESACQCRGHRFEPWSGKIPHAAEQLGLWATTTEPAHLEPVLRNKKKAKIVRGPRTAMKSGPHLPQLEKALAQKQRPNTAKKKKSSWLFLAEVLFLVQKFSVAPHPLRSNSTGLSVTCKTFLVLAPVSLTILPHSHNFQPYETFCSSPGSSVCPSFCLECSSQTSST